MINVGVTFYPVYDPAGLWHLAVLLYEATQ